MYMHRDLQFSHGPSATPQGISRGHQVEPPRSQGSRAVARRSREGAIGSQGEPRGSQGGAKREPGGHQIKQNNAIESNEIRELKIKWMISMPNHNTRYAKFKTNH